jgi:hypothetical protein
VCSPREKKEEEEEDSSSSLLLLVFANVSKVNFALIFTPPRSSPGLAQGLSQSSAPGALLRIKLVRDVPG